ncbi:MAG: hypothetical protein A07HB70_01501 [uncultured archaeon A07HB70]|jgi:Uncharacterized conserved protein|nr:MAG: hypothetical protein A07HB70_01501 [uncultured archaeon A07HB70]
MQPAARLGDLTAHGTGLGHGPGSPDVLIGGQPAWRAGVDFHACPLVLGAQPHAGGPTTTGSSTVLINGYPAARAGDIIVENGPPNTITIGEPTVLIGGGSASAEPAWAASLYEQLSSYVPEYNQSVTERDLGRGGEQLSNQTINLYVTADGGEAVFSFRTDGSNRIEEFQRGGREVATVRMETDRETVERITGSQSPAEAFRQAIADGDISISGIGTVQEIKWRILNGIRALS